MWRYLLSRRGPAALGLLAVLGALLWGGAALTVEHRRRTRRAGSDPADDRGRAAAVIAVTTPGPFGDPERAACCRLPWLRLAAVVALTAAAFGALAARAGAGALCPSNTERPCLNGWRPPAGQGLARLGDHDGAERGAPRSASAGGIRDAYPPVVSARGACLLATSRPVPDGSEEHAVTGSLGTGPATGH